MTDLKLQPGDGHAGHGTRHRKCAPTPARMLKVVLLERACGGQLVNRGPRPGGTAILTPLGRQLCEQARDYLGIRPGPGTP